MKRSAISFKDASDDVVEFEPVDAHTVMVTAPVGSNVILQEPQLRALLEWLNKFLEEVDDASDDRKYIRRYEVET